MNTEDQVVEYFSETLLRAVMPEGTPIIFVYQNPDDYPENYVARLFDGTKSTHLIALAGTIEELIEAKPEHMERIGKQEKDPEKVVETWL